MARNIRQDRDGPLAQQRSVEVDGLNYALHSLRSAWSLHMTNRNKKSETWDERDEAGSAAWNAPGVTEVENDLAVSF
jgi:hypothetical protein